MSHEINPIFAELGKGKHAVHFDYTYIRTQPDSTQPTN